MSLAELCAIVNGNLLALVRLRQDSRYPYPPPTRGAGRLITYPLPRRLGTGEKRPVYSPLPRRKKSGEFRPEYARLPRLDSRPARAYCGREKPSSFLESAAVPLFNSPLPSPPAGPYRQRKYAYWYDSIIEWMLANPKGSLKDCAAALGRTPQTLYLVTNSDVFKLRYEQRRKEHFESLSQGILLRTARVAERSLEILEQRLENEPEKISTKAILETANSTLERLGYGAPAPAQTNISVNAQPQVAVTVSPDILSDAREQMRRVQQMNATETPAARQLPGASASAPAAPSLDEILDLSATSE